MKLIMYNRHVLIRELPILYHKKKLTVPSVRWFFDDVIVWSEVHEIS